MRFGDNWFEKLSRCVLMLFSILLLALAGTCIVFLFQDGLVEISLLFLSGLFFLGWLVLFHSLWDWAVTELSEDGITVYFLGFRLNYPWDAIQQAGILEPFYREYRPSIAFVTKKGAPLLPGSLVGWFYYRNAFRMIRVPCTEESVAYICKHYGKLDFDRRNRRRT